MKNVVLRRQNILYIIICKRAFKLNYNKTEFLKHDFNFLNIHKTNKPRAAIRDILVIYTRIRFSSYVRLNIEILGNNEGPSKKEEIEDEEEEEEETETSSESSETDSDEDSDDAKPKTPVSKGMEKTDIGPLLARSAQARESGSNSSSRRTSQDESYTRSRYNIIKSGLNGFKQNYTL